MNKITYEEWTKENPIDLDNYDDDEEDGMINEMHYQLYLWVFGLKAFLFRQRCLRFEFSIGVSLF